MLGTRMEKATKTTPKVVAELNEFDVILGRGKGSQNRPGNAYFRKLAAENASKYVMAATTKEKTDIAGQILTQIEDNGGRFLQAVAGIDAHGGHFVEWVETSRNVVLTKTKQAICDVTKSRKKLTARKKKLEEKAAQSLWLAEEQRIPNSEIAEGSLAQQQQSHVDELEWLQQDYDLHDLPAGSPVDTSHINTFCLHPLLRQDTNMPDSQLLRLPLSEPTRQEQNQLQQWDQAFSNFRQQQQLALFPPNRVDFQPQQTQQPQSELLDQLARQQELMKLRQLSQLQQEHHVQEQQHKEHLELLRFKQKQQELAQLRAIVLQQRQELDQSQQEFSHLRNSLLDVTGGSSGVSHLSPTHQANWDIFNR